jgi:hypothetical protein
MTFIRLHRKLTKLALWEDSGLKWECNPNSKLYHWLAQNLTTSNSTSHPSDWEDAWISILYQDTTSQLRYMSAGKLWYTSPEYDDGNPSPNTTLYSASDGFRSGQPFAAVRTADSDADPPYIKILTPVAGDVSGVISESKKVPEDFDFSINTWNGSCSPDSCGRSQGLYCKWALRS